MDITYSNATQVHEVIAQKHWEQTHKARHTGHSTLGTAHWAQTQTCRGRVLAISLVSSNLQMLEFQNNLQGNNNSSTINKTNRHILLTSTITN